MGSISRREFVRLGADALSAAAATKATVLEPTVLAAKAAESQRKIRFVSIRTGIRGCDLLRSSRRLPKGICVETADLYDMHRKPSVEARGAVANDSCFHKSVAALEAATQTIKG